MDIFSILFYQPLYNILVVLYRLFGNDLGLAIVGIAIISRLITYPITRKQILMAEQNQLFNERVKEVKAKYSKDKDRQAKEMLKIQSEYLPGQLSGCLSLIVQFILLISIFNVIRNLFEVGVSSFNEVAYSFVPLFEVGKLINTSFLNIIDLSVTPGSLIGGDLLPFLPYLVLILTVGASQYLSTKVLMGLRKKKENKKPEAKSKKKKKGEEPIDFAEIMQRSTQQTLMIFPILIVAFSLSVPAGLSLYWTVQSGLVIIQQVITDKLEARKANEG